MPRSRTYVTAVASAAALATALVPGPAHAATGTFMVGLYAGTTDTIEIYSDQWSDSAIDDVITVTLEGGQLRVHNEAADVTAALPGCTLESSTGDALCGLAGVTDLYVRLGWGNDSWDSRGVGLDVEVVEQSASDPSARVVKTGAGDDLVRGGYSRNTLSTGAGDDEIRPGPGAGSVVLAGPGDDHLFNEGRNQTLDGEAGNDLTQTMCGAWQAGTVLRDTAPGGIDTVDASFSVDRLTVVGTGQGLAMRCAVIGQARNATVLKGGFERVRLSVIIGGDRVDLSKTTAKGPRMSWYLYEGDDDFTGPSRGFPVTVLGASNDDVILTGSASGDLVRGGAGDDRIADIGGRADELRGDGGRDVLGGRDGKRDLLHGGAGRDACFSSPRALTCERVDRKQSIERR